jgi:hypothetical protein
MTYTIPKNVVAFLKAQNAQNAKASKKAKSSKRQVKPK